MGIEKIPENKDIPDYNALCPQCKGYTVFIHNLKCTICDNKEVVWCPTCQEHFRVTIE
jgi:hypothetical protein